MDFIRAPRAKYTVVGEALRYVIPGHMQCSMGCGGQACKYDNPNYWEEDKQAIKGLYSSWITEHLLAMSRPSTEIIKTYKIIEQFKRSGIKTVINLQRPGEHAHCGDALEPESGFSYRPEVFMENDIYFYNYGWEDYGVANLKTMLDIMKVMAFAMQEGKIAIHCHAGLGRTGVLIACFLTYTSRMTADQAILYVRAKRPNSIQTRGQLQCVREFVKFLIPLRSVFSCAEPRTYPVTLSQFLIHQGHMLHGYERREMKHLPKIIQLVCRLLRDIAENRQVIEEDILEAPDIQDIEMTLNTIQNLNPEFSFGQDALSLRPRLPGPPTLPRHFNEPPIFYHRKSLSYSDSDLRRLGSELNLLAQPLTSLSQDNVNAVCSPSVSKAKGQNGRTNRSVTSFGSASSLWELKNVVNNMDGSPLLKRMKQRTIQRSESVGPNQGTPKKGGSLLTRWKTQQRSEVSLNDKKQSEVEVSEVPFITLQAELSLEGRRLLVAQALAVDLFQDGEKEHRDTVLAWQAELNLGGAWERLCLERDPFILTGLMWAWLEQLREPVVPAQAAKSLDRNSSDTKSIFNPLDKAPRETLMCVLDCMAHMLTVPEEVENAFLDRTVKAFTQLEKNSEEGKKVYDNMTVVLKYVLMDMRWAAIQEEENSVVSLLSFDK